MFQNFSFISKSWHRPLTKLNNRQCSFRRKNENLDPKTIPKLVYMYNPLLYFATKLQLLKLRLFWDKEFAEEEFIRGTKQSAIVVTDSIRNQDGEQIGQFTTPVGFQQITRDMILSRNDHRLKMIRFRPEDLIRAVPMKVSLLKRGKRKNCLIDMIFVGMRNTRDFPNPEESQIIHQALRKIDQNMDIDPRVLSVPHRIVFAEIYMRFFRDYSRSVRENWDVAFYKIVSFDILNYDPQ